VACAVYIPSKIDVRCFQHVNEVPIIPPFDESLTQSAWPKVWPENEHNKTWFLVVADIFRVLTGSSDAGAYWRKLKQRLKAGGSEVVTHCHGLKLVAEDGKRRLTDVASAETLRRLVQSVPSPKAEPITL